MMWIDFPNDKRVCLVHRVVTSSCALDSLEPHSSLSSRPLLISCQTFVLASLRHPLAILRDIKWW